ncbi:aldo/keto reductase [Paractinoplanes atraurantiacus]|uniref:D-threo-aldose 1-dehydrogenase n=1 Tax=Paractinoplanes atraurantiacus TaxID=1036182 RepID=A0A285JRQ1_9ACTN|nr:aldo/keto reductase [Actinoplanes atraurantiacus]SNY62979.1 D-threo-aldose 1-dehydrogenase [Actinoplanes atraurantiacus]
MGAELALGVAALGDIPDEDEAVATVLAAHRAGITRVDTSPWYGRGAAERRLGRAVAALPPGSLTISTKVGYVIERARREQDFSAAAVERSLAASMDRLGVDSLDTVLIHDPEDHMAAALEQAYPRLHQLRTAGVVRAIGAGMNQTAGLIRFVRETDIDVVLVAGRWTLLDRGAGEALLPECRARGVRAMAGGVFNTGVLVSPEPGARYDYAPAAPAVLERARSLRETCRAYGVPLAAAALQFPARDPAVGAVLLGPADRQQLAQNIEWWRHPVPAALWSELEA